MTTLLNNPFLLSYNMSTSPRRTRVFAVDDRNLKITISGDAPSDSQSSPPSPNSSVATHSRSPSKSESMSRSPSPVREHKKRKRADAPDIEPENAPQSVSSFPSALSLYPCFAALCVPSARCEDAVTLSMDCMHCVHPLRPSRGLECCLLSREIRLNFAFCITTDVLSRAQHGLPGTDRYALWRCQGALTPRDMMVECTFVTEWKGTQNAPLLERECVVSHQYPTADPVHCGCPFVLRNGGGNMMRMAIVFQHRLHRKRWCR